MIIKWLLNGDQVTNILSNDPNEHIFDPNDTLSHVTVPILLLERRVEVVETNP